jgi:hypothetical protein
MIKALVAAPLQGWFTDFVTALRTPSLMDAEPESATLLSFQPRSRQTGGRAVVQATGQNLVNGDSRH